MFDLLYKQRDYCTVNLYKIIVTLLTINYGGAHPKNQSMVLMFFCVFFRFFRN